MSSLVILLIGMVLIALGAVYFLSREYWITRGIKYNYGFWLGHVTQDKRLEIEKTRILMVSIGLILFGSFLTIVAALSAV